MVCEAVQQRPGETFRAEDPGPLVEREVGGRQDGAPLVALAEDLKEQFRAGAGQWDKAQFVDDEQVAAAANPTGIPRWQAARPSPRATWVLPAPLLPTAMTFSLFWTSSQRVSSVTSCLFTAGIAGKSKVSRLFMSGKRAARIRLSTMRWRRSMSSRPAGGLVSAPLAAGLGGQHRPN